ncbi:MAG: hypothetical protein LH466_08025 [Sphingomonas bacterium]|nr:hypothetical protein [Sphingomonas bacterium]
MRSPAEVREFFAWSNGILDTVVLRPLSHITQNWELTWDHDAREYEPEENSFASALNRLIGHISTTLPPKRYHDNEDRLAEFVIASLGWKIRKENGRWVGEDYDFILEQGGSTDWDQIELLNAAAGRVHAAMDRGQMHFDDMEESHRRMLAAIMTIILYHRSDSLEL